jgi:hypothetical protein
LLTSVFLPFSFSPLQLVIDGIAATVRTQTDRNETLAQIASALKLLSETLGIAVVVTNQVTTTFVHGNKEGDGTGQATHRYRVHAAAVDRLCRHPSHSFLRL